MDFKVALARVLLAEGGLVDDPSDPGGRTNHGVTQRKYDEWRAKTGKASQPVDLITDQEIEQLYREDFWDKVDGDELPDAVAFQALDFAVNSGCETAVRYLQQAAGVADDGHVGPVTIASLKATPPAVLLVTLLALRLRFMTKLKNWPNAGKGWASRIATDLLLGAEDLA